MILSEIEATVPIIIKPLRWWEAWRFAKLRNQIDGETRYLVASGDERRERGHCVLIRLLLNRHLTTLVARHGREHLGYVSLVFARFKKLRGNAYLTISVKGGYRGQGLGTRLLTAAEELAKERGIRRIELEVFSQNPAVSLYKRLGYEVEGVKKQAVQMNDGFDDIVFMVKFLN